MKQPKPKQLKHQQPPTSYGVSSTTKTAKISGDSNGMRVQHREYVADVLGSASYLVSGRSINPGQASTFPWLSLIAANFEKYRFRKLHFVYESSVATTAAGVVLSAIDLDASDPAPSSKQAIMSYQCAERSNVWMSHTTRMPMQQPSLYVRTGPLPVNTDIKTYDAGNFFLAIQGSATTAQGELYVEYDVDLYVPQLSNAPSVASLSYKTSSTVQGYDFTNGTFTGSLAYVVTGTSNRLAVAMAAGTQIQVTITYTSAQTAAAAAVVPVSAFGGNGTTIDTFKSADVSGARAATYIIQCNASTTVAPYVGYLVLEFPNSNVITPASQEFYITSWQVGAV